jgi:hypothetical protein
MRSLRARLFALAVVAAVVAGGGAAWATDGGGSTSQLQACAGKLTGLLRLVQSQSACFSTETYVVWNVQGRRA